MREVLTDLDHVTPEWLTEVLQHTGHLERGHVATVQLKTVRSTLASMVTHLEICYTDDATPSAPSRLFLKTSRPGLVEALPTPGQREVAFYNRIVASMPNPPTVRCYDAACSPAAKKFHLLLEDLSASHFQTEWPMPPTQLLCEHVIDSLAKFHAYWWDHARLTQEIGVRPTETSMQRDFRWMEQTLPAFLDFLGDRLSRERRAIYDQVLQAASTLTRRLIADQGLTFIHGDAHVWNFLLPHNIDTDTVRIIDWQSWRVGLGAMDLAYMMALHWYPERRARMEQMLLRWYHTQLLAYGVVGYAWDAYWYDYRLSVLRNLFIPIWQWSAKIGPATWWSHLERAMLAFEDLQCRELL
jgi:hypothetical protein